MNEILLSSLLVEESRYRHGRELWCDEMLARSVAMRSLLMPLIVCDDGSGKIHLVDGYKRVAAARAAGHTIIPCVHLAKETTPIELASLVLHETFNQTTASPAAKGSFINFAIGLGVPRDQIIKEFLPALGFEPHERLLRKIEKVMALPQDLLDYARRKNFSLKNLLALTRTPTEALNWLFGHGDSLHLTASIVEELGERINDHLRATDITFEQFVTESEIDDIFSVQNLPHERTAALRVYIAKLRYPTLTTINNKLDKFVADLSLPTFVTVARDRTLEIPGLRITIEAKSRDELDLATDALGHAQNSLLFGELFKQ